MGRFHNGRRSVALAAVTTLVGGAAIANADWLSEGSDASRTGRTAVDAAQEPAPATGWPLLSPGTAGPAAVTANSVYLASAFGNTMRAYSTSGVPKWAFRRAPASVLRFFSPPTIGLDGTVYTTGGTGGGGTESALFAIRPDGTLKWQSAPVTDASFALRGAIVATPTRVYVRSATRLNAFNPADGTSLWSVAAPNAGTAGPTLALAPDGSLYTASSPEPSGNAGELVALNADGSVRWTRPVGRDPRIAVGATGTVYVSQNVTQVPAQPARVTAFDPSGGTVWSVDIPGGASSVSAPAVTPAGWVFVGTSDGLLRALIPGNPGWFLNVGPDVERHRPAIGGDGTVYASARNKLVAVSPSGVFQWSAPTAGGPLGIGPNGTVYVSGSSVYAFSGPQAAPVVSDLRATPSTFRVRGVPWHRAGTRLRFTLNRSAGVSFVVRRGSTIVGRLLVDRTSSGDVPFSGTPGPNTVRFTGTAFRPTGSSTTTLRPGTYTVTAVARIPSGLVSRASTTFRVLPGSGAVPLDN
jgi:hypothetical protein